MQHDFDWQARGPISHAMDNVKSTARPTAQPTPLPAAPHLPHFADGAAAEVAEALVALQCHLRVPLRLLRGQPWREVAAPRRQT